MTKQSIFVEYILLQNSKKHLKFAGAHWQMTKILNQNRLGEMQN